MAELATGPPVVAMGPGRRPIPGSCCHHTKLIAAETCAEINLAQFAAKSSRDRSEGCVARGVLIQVVHTL